MKHRTRTEERRYWRDLAKQKAREQKELVDVLMRFPKSTSQGSIMNKQKQAGYTLMELAVVIGFLGALTVGGTVLYYLVKLLAKYSA